MTQTRFGWMAARVLLDSLDAQSYASSNRHVLDWLPASARMSLFGALMEQATGRVRVAAGGQDGGPAHLELRAIARAAVDVVPILVAGTNGGPGLGPNVVTEGFASHLRDVYALEAERPRLLVVLTEQGNETQRSAQDPLADAGLLRLEALALALVRKSGLAEGDALDAVARVYVARQRPDADWDVALARLGDYLDTVAHRPREDQGRHLPALGVFLPDPGFASGAPLNLLSEGERRRVLGPERLHENAAAHELLESVFDDPMVDEERALRDHFDADTVERLLEVRHGDWKQIDVEALRRGEGRSRKKNAFRYESLAVRGAHTWKRTEGGDSPILAVATTGAFAVEVELLRGYIQKKERVLLLAWDETKRRPASLAGGVSIDHGGTAVTCEVPAPVGAFAVYRLAITRGPRSFKAIHDEIAIAVYRTAESQVAVESGLALSFEHQAWERTGALAGFHLYRGAGADAAVERVDVARTEGVPADEDAEADASDVQDVRVGALVTRVLWESDVAPVSEAEATSRTLEECIYAPPRGFRQREIVEALAPHPSYLQAVTEITPDPGGHWTVELAGRFRFRVESGNRHGQERAVARALVTPQFVRFESAGDELRAVEPPPTTRESLGPLWDARARLFQRLARAAQAALRRRTQPLDAAPVPLALVELEPFREEIEAYAALWVETMERAMGEGGPFDAVHEWLLGLDTLRISERGHDAGRLVVLPLHPWLLRALLEYQAQVARDIREAHQTKTSARLGLSASEVDQLVPREVVEDWYVLAGQLEHLRVVDGAPFTLEFVADAERGVTGLDYVSRVVAAKIRRYIEMHPHLRGGARTLRLGFINPGDAGQLLDGLREWIRALQPSQASDELAELPALEVVLFGADDRLDDLGGRLDEFFRTRLGPGAEMNDVDRILIGRLRYRKARGGRPSRPADFVHICFAQDLVRGARQPQDGALKDGWDGGFGDGILATYLRRNQRAHDGENLTSRRGLWLTAPEGSGRRGLAALLTLLRGRRSGHVDPALGTFWDVVLPSVKAHRDLYEFSDWVVHLDRELSLEMFHANGADGPKIIEYSDQHVPLSPGYDTITVTRHDEPYREQLGHILGLANVDIAGRSAEATESGRQLLEDISVLSGSWALDFLLGSQNDVGLRNRLKGNVGAALAYRWLRRVERPCLPHRTVPVYVSLEEVIRATPAAGLKMTDGLMKRFSNEDPNEKKAQQFCDDLLVLYLTPTARGEPSRLFGRIIEVKFGKSADTPPVIEKAIAQVRHTQELLAQHLAGDNDRADAAFRHRQLSLLLKAQVEQAVAMGVLSPDEVEALDVPALSANLATGNYVVDYVHGWGREHVLGDVFLLSTNPAGELARTLQPDLRLADGVRLVRFGQALVDWLAFQEGYGPTLNEEPVSTVLHLGRLDGTPLVRPVEEQVETGEEEGRGEAEDDDGWGDVGDGPLDRTHPSIGLGWDIQCRCPVCGQEATGPEEVEERFGTRPRPPRKQDPPGAPWRMPQSWCRTCRTGPRKAGETATGQAANAGAEGRPTSVEPTPALALAAPPEDETCPHAIPDLVTEKGRPSPTGQGAVEPTVEKTGSGLAEAAAITVCGRPYPPHAVADVVARLERALRGHRVELEAPPAAPEADQGPRLLRVYVRLRAGESINSIRRVSEDIARDVGTVTPDIHITNVPERHAVGLDLPVRGMSYDVTFQALADHPSFRAAARELTLGFCAGIDVTGRPLWVDLARMPHMLVAGTTGSGKTVFLRSLVLTLIMNRPADTLDLRLSSTKPMDFLPFVSLPHARGRALSQSPEEALALVGELVEEMDRRIARISAAQCDNLVEYNAEAEPQLPHIVAVLDEYAETYSAFTDKADRQAFETGVARLAQKARAAGIHLVLCMQRPDANAIGGAIKSNILHRFALKLPQLHDSRVILDEPGAETLLGQGDLLYKDANGRTHRLQVPNLERGHLTALLEGLRGGNRERGSRDQAGGDQAPPGEGQHEERPASAANACADEGDIPLEDLGLPQDYTKLLKRIQNTGAAPLTVRGILDLLPEVFWAMQGVGETYVRRLASLRAELPGLLERWRAERAAREVRDALRDRLDAEDVSFNQTFLDTDERRALNKLRHHFEDELTAGFVLRLDVGALSEQPAFGRKTADVVARLQARVLEDADSRAAQPLLPPSAGLLVWSTPDSLDAATLDVVLCQDLDRFLSQANEHCRLITTARWGIERPHQTLEQIASSVGMVRESVRQLENKYNARLAGSQRVHARVIAASLLARLHADLAEALPCLSARFQTPRQFLEYLELISGADDGSLVARQAVGRADVQVHLLDAYFAETPQPVTREMLVDEIQSSFGHDAVRAEKILTELVARGVLRPERGAMLPLRLTSNAAIAHVLAEHRHGLPWRRVVTLVNTRRLTATPLSDERQVAAFGSSPYVHLHGSGHYRHNRFFDLDESRIEEMLHGVKRHLDQSGRESANLQNLHQDIGGSYFDLRHVVRQYGEARGIYFIGRSRIDTVALRPDADLVSLKQAVLRMLEDARQPLSIAEIADRLVSGSEQLATLHVQALRAEGKVVRVEATAYTSADRAFDGIDFDLLGVALLEVLERDRRIVEVDVVREELNAQLGLARSKYFYQGAIQRLAAECSLHVARTLVSTAPVPFASLSDAVRAAMAEGLSNRDVLTRLRERIRLTRSCETMIMNWLSLWASTERRAPEASPA